ncbi:MAG: LPS-assembly protein LptD [Deltaproteobacteria bacterium]|nr:LPS-assembly protein LptD [Deltaproteobacteria bacterium]
MPSNTCKLKYQGHTGRRVHGLFIQTAMIPRCVYAFLILIIMVLFPCGVRAEDLDQALDSPDIPWNIVADELSYDNAAKVYTAEGNVQISKADKKISADHIRFDHENMKVEASGHIVISSGEDLISADNLSFDLVTEKGQISNGRLYIQKNNFHIWSDNLRKTGKDTYQAQKASVTTCDGEKPAWKITGRNLNVTIEGYGYAYHAAFWVKNVPVFYSPWIGFPVKTQRQTGLLTPQAGLSNSKGYEYNQPFFWAINASSDATFYWHYMSERGNKFGAEYRYALSPLSKGTTMFDYLDDRRIDDTTGVEDEGTDYPRLNSDRYWFRTRNDQELPGNFNALLDMDIVSDQDYLTDFKRGYTGFEITRDYYNKIFGRDLDDYNDPIRLNRFNINRNWMRYNLNAEIRWYDNIIARTQDLSNSTVQRLPFVQFKGSKQALGNTPFLFDLDSEYTHFYRETTTTTNSVTQDHRFDLHPRAYLPLDLGHYFTFEPSLGLRETIWNVQAYENPPLNSEANEFQHREMFDIGMNLSSEIYRIFGGNPSPNRMKHTLNPRVNYSYIPDYNQTDYPEFDSIDRIEAENQVTYSITNLFVLRRPDLRNTGPQDGKPVYRYHQVARFDIGQSYDFREAYEDDPLEWTNGQTREPFSPVYARLDITPERYFKLSTNVDWSVYDNEPVSHNIAAGFFDRRNDRLAIEHRYTRETNDTSQDGVNSFAAEGFLKVTRPLSLIARYEYDLYTDKELETSFGILYGAQCWSLDLRYIKDVHEILYSFQIHLNGLGGFGSGVEHKDVASRF